MLRVRKVKTKPGSAVIQVVRYTGHSANFAKHIGSAKVNSGLYHQFRYPGKAFFESHFNY